MGLDRKTADTCSGSLLIPASVSQCCPYPMQDPVVPLAQHMQPLLHEGVVLTEQSGNLAWSMHSPLA